MDRDLAIAQLNALAAVPGALRIITSEVRPDLREDPRNPRSHVRTELLAQLPDLLHNRRSFVAHDVRELRGPNPNGEFMAVSAEGDLCIGQPGGLLQRLTEWNRQAAFKSLEPGHAHLLANPIEPKASVWGAIKRWVK